MLKGGVLFGEVFLSYFTTFLFFFSQTRSRQASLLLSGRKDCSGRFFSAGIKTRRRDRETVKSDEMTHRRCTYRTHQRVNVGTSAGRGRGAPTGVQERGIPRGCTVPTYPPRVYSTPPSLGPSPCSWVLSPAPGSFLLLLGNSSSLLGTVLASWEQF